MRHLLRRTAGPSSGRLPRRSLDLAGAAVLLVIAVVLDRETARSDVTRVLAAARAPAGAGRR
ncbi:hypothetical protein [Geodermatophilus obscurus]|uniref:Uncharacterized protein n=1 Tax=Geodermatophilus obscurus (strain ATCC 25078 / DSM 43160 / JCM 3152 / CCUG 61914 / KCC A-0152 / KCTC 9177 / NBRC 13315 / NRRL B-3577 / G-20) TaxID=526225 RepID=D2SB05_GEOOG|nr:hypothetical protein [Geodermatophilus obscurus]ADB76040.1 hypothetical protein Gobs_3439 [Geodermatophilus obscurus DSM 43160]